MMKKAVRLQIQMNSWESMMNWTGEVNSVFASLTDPNAIIPVQTLF